jgi:hypothetical protein
MLSLGSNYFKGMYEDEKFALQDRFIKIEGLKIKNAEAKNHYISISYSILQKDDQFDLDFNTGAEIINGTIKHRLLTIIHEVSSHITLANQGVPLKEQHTVTYGTPDGYFEKYEEGSPNDLLVKEVNKIFK